MLTFAIKNGMETERQREPKQGRGNLNFHSAHKPPKKGQHLLPSVLFTHREGALVLGEAQGVSTGEMVVWFIQLLKGWYPSEDLCYGSLDWGPRDPRQVVRTSTVMGTAAESLLPPVSPPLLSQPQGKGMDWGYNTQAGEGGG